MVAQSLSVIHLLPELEEGGVERHVLMLSGQQRRDGHEVHVVSAGGKLVSQLAEGIIHIRLPVHRKNPLTGIYCAARLAVLFRKDKPDILHAHSRVPAWIAMLTSKFCKRPYIVTAHAYFSTQARWIYLPYRKAMKVICVSKAVQDGMKKCFAGNTLVIRNGMLPVETTWRGSCGPKVKFLFVGRLTHLKGLQDILQVLATVPGNWQLDILGDGPLRKHLENTARSLKLAGKAIFHGFHDDPDDWMAQSDCLLFPSYVEGMPLTLARAIQIGLPIIASDIEPVREMSTQKDGLVKPGDLAAWKNALEAFLATKQPPTHFNRDAIPTIAQMAQEVQSVYESVNFPKDGGR